MKESYEDACRILSAAGIEEARLDAWLLLEFQLHISRAWFYAHPEQSMAPEDHKEYMCLVQRRADRCPLTQITGEAWFMGYGFRVNEHVLSPRQDTETLVLAALEVLPEGGTVLDLCTGTGCILLSILLERRDVSGVGTDLSAKALETAMENASRHHIKEEAEWLQGDLFSARGLEGRRFDLICSNPPYIPAKDIDGLMPEVSRHEPRMALDGGEDGMTFYRRIADQAPGFLLPGGRCLCEIGYDQGPGVRQIFEHAGFGNVQIRKDLAGHDRVIIASELC